MYLDTSGESLFKRGWRMDKGEAPLKENLAAGLLMLSGWEPGMPLFDPFCGSGTTGVACAELARNFVGIDLDESHLELARRRIAGVNETD
jgi:putative N6-adenine-specific DNA methylase